MTPTLPLLHAPLDERLSALRSALDSHEQWGLSDSDVEILCLQHGLHVDRGALGMHQQTGVRISLVLGDTVYQLVRLSTGILRPIGTGSYDGGVPDRPVLVSLPGDRWPWWHCPSCGLELHCPLENMNDGQCPDCNDPFVEGRLPSELRIALDPAARRDLDSLGQALDEEPVTDEEGREAVQRLGIDTEAWAAAIRERIAAHGPPRAQCPWCYELDGMHRFGCVSERVRQELEAAKARKAGG